MVEQTALVKALHDRGRGFECLKSVIDSLFPFRMRQIGTESDTATTPSKRRKSAHLQKKIAIFLAKFRGLAPVMNLQARYDRMLWQGRRIEEPRIGDHFL